MAPMAPSLNRSCALPTAGATMTPTTTNPREINAFMILVRT
jgi:hypothetical protein